MASPHPSELLEDLLRLADRFSQVPESAVRDLPLEELSAAQARALQQLGRLLSSRLGRASAVSGASSGSPELAQELGLAAQRGELRLHYQPQVDLSNGRIVGVESLIRWQHPRLGLVPPSRFIPLAEETGQIVGIGEWALREACVQAQAWCGQGLEGLCVAVNLSARQFSQPDLVQIVAGALRAGDLRPGLLELELTESCVMEDPVAGALQLTAISDLGVRTAIDDFGTGYSSLNHLSRFPIKVLKIDQSFVRGITGDPYDAALVSAINAMAHSLGMKSVAEGVETPEQLALLKGCGCDVAQGYLLARPAPPEALDLRRRYA